MSESLNNCCVGYIRMALSDMAALPPAGESWQTSETELEIGDVQRLAAKQVIEPVGWDGNSRIWQTRKPAWEEIQRRRDDLGVLACGHRPFSTVDLDAIKPYSCLRESCDARYTRAEIEAVIDGE